MPAPKLRWNGKDLYVYRSEYHHKDRHQLAILMFEEDDKSGVPYGTLTINSDDPMYGNNSGHLIKGYDLQFIDTRSWPGIMWVLNHDENNDWVKPLPVPFQPKFIPYPLCVFRLDKIPHI